MIDCNITKNYIHERERMCERNQCFVCPLSSLSNGTNKTCRVFENCYPDKAIEIVQKWSNEHPQKTYLSEFLKHYPNALLRTDGIPKFICPHHLGLKSDCENEGSNNCVKCWNTLINNEGDDEND